MANCQVRLEVFEGPLDLLLHLIEKNKINIYDIPIAEIADQYIAYLAAMEAFDMEVASEFVVMAATLLLLKSRMLLPKPPQPVTDEEEKDPRQELVDQLLEYRKFKQAAAVLESCRQERSRYFTRQHQDIAVRLPLPEGLTVNDLIAAFLATVKNSGVLESAFIEREEISVQDKMNDILIMLQQNTKLEFGQVIMRSGTRGEMVAGFLALLELLRLRQITIFQSVSFGPIYIERKEPA